MPPERPNDRRRLWTNPREEDEHQPWLAPPVRVVPTPPKLQPPDPKEPAPPPQKPLRPGRVALAMLAVIAAMALFLGTESKLDENNAKNAALPEAPEGAAPADERSQQIRAVYNAASPSVVNIQVGEGRRTGSGTGFLVDNGGTFVTNAHVVGTADKAQVQLTDGGKIVEGDVVGRDESSDLAVVRVDRDEVDDIEPLAFADSDTVQVGDLAVAIGYPLGLDRTATAGIVSGVGRQLSAPNGFSIDKVIQTDAPINPGNSGGPLLDSRGRVIGVNSQIATTGTGSGSIGIGFSVPSNTAKDIVPRLKKGAKILRGYLGVQTGDAPGSPGATIGRVSPGGPADSAGLRARDVIVAIDGRRITGADEVTRLIADGTPGDRVEMIIERDGDQATVTVTLGERPASVIP